MHVTQGIAFFVAVLISGQLSVLAAKTAPIRVGAYRHLRDISLFEAESLAFSERGLSDGSMSLSFAPVPTSAPTKSLMTMGSTFPEAAAQTQSSSAGSRTLATVRAAKKAPIRVGSYRRLRDISLFEAESLAFFERGLSDGSMSLSLALVPTPAPTTSLLTMGPTLEETVAPTYSLSTGSPTPTTGDSSTQEPTSSETGTTVSPSPAPVETPQPTPMDTSTTEAPTVLPTLESTQTAPTSGLAEGDSPLLTGCETSYVHCGDDVSVCFIGGVLEAGKSGGAWGWSVDLSPFNLTDELSLECNVYAGAAQCELDKGTLVGSFLVSKNAVQWKFLAGVGGSDFHFYAGTCEGNDGGAHLVNQNACDQAQVASRTRVPGSYSLVADGGGDGFDPLLPVFELDETNQNDPAFRKKEWASENYLVFPLTSPGRQWMSAHATVCPCSAASNGCTTKDVSSLEEGQPKSIDADLQGESMEPLAMGVMFTTIAVAVAAALLVVTRRGGYGTSSSYDSLEEISLSDPADPDIEI